MQGFEIDESIVSLITSVDDPSTLTTQDISVLTTSSYSFDPSTQIFTITSAELDDPVINTPELYYFGVDRIRAFDKDVS